MAGASPGELTKRKRKTAVYIWSEVLAVPGRISVAWDSAAVLWGPENWYPGPHVLKQEKWA